MTQKEFLRRFAKIADQFLWRLGGDQYIEPTMLRGQARGLSGAKYCFCPITALHKAEMKGYVSEECYFDAANAIGMGWKLANIIAMAADTDKPTPLRKKLIAICGT